MKRNNPFMLCEIDYYRLLSHWYCANAFINDWTYCLVLSCVLEYLSIFGCRIFNLTLPDSSLIRVVVYTLQCTLYDRTRRLGV